MRHIDVDHDVADPTMSWRSRRTTSLGAIIVYGISALMIIPFLLQKTAIAEFCIWLAIVMAGGLIIAGMWGIGSLFVRNPVTDKRVDDRSSKAIATGLVSAFLAIMMFVTTWLVASIGSNSWDSYSLLKSGGLITYVLLGLLPVVAYIVALHAVATRQVITSLGWGITTIVCMAVSLLGPWFWSGYRLYLDYHVI